MKLRAKVYEVVLTALALVSAASPFVAVFVFVVLCEALNRLRYVYPI